MRNRGLLNGTKEMGEQREREHQESRKRERRGIHREMLHYWVSVLGTTQGRKFKAHITTRL